MTRPEPAPLTAVLADLARTFAESGTDWYLLGALAAQIYGVVRSTADIDVTIRLGSTAPALLIDRLESAGFEALFRDQAFIEASRVIPVRHTATGIMVDIVLAGPGLEDRFFERSSTREVAGARIPVASAEDLVIMKVLAAREKDLSDCRAILSRGATVDRAYVESTLRELEEAMSVSDLLPLWQQLLTDAGR